MMSSSPFFLVLSLLFSSPLLTSSFLSPSSSPLPSPPISSPLSLPISSPSLPLSLPLPSLPLPLSSPPPLSLYALKKGEEKKEEPSFESMDGSGVRIGIVRARWNSEIISNLDSGIKTALEECSVKKENIFETVVPGSWELPLAVRFLAMSRQCDVIIACGCLIKGDTMHFEYIADTVSKGLMDVQLQSTIPCIFGVLTTLTEKQAIDRSTGENNHGYQWGMAAVEMALLRSDALKPVPTRGTLDLVNKNGEMKALTEGGEEKETKEEEEKKVKKPFGF